MKNLPILLFLALFCLRNAEAQNNRYYFRVVETDNIIKNNALKCSQVNVYTKKSTLVYNSNYPKGTSLSDGTVLYGEPDKLYTEIGINQTVLKYPEAYVTDDDYAQYNSSNNNYTLYATQSFTYGGCTRTYTRKVTIDVDNPILISSVDFVNAGGSPINGTHSCIKDNYRVKVVTAQFYNSGKNENILQIWSKNNTWVTLPGISLASGGGTYYFTYNQIKNYVNIGSPIKFRTSKKQLDGKYSYSEWGTHLYYYNDLKLTGAISFEVTKCGDSPVIKIPLPSTYSYTIGIEIANASNYSFKSGGLTYSGGYFYIDNDTKIANEHCSGASCHPNLQPGQKFKLTVEHDNKNITPCPYEGEHTIPNYPKFTVANVNVPAYTDNNNKEIHIKEAGKTANFNFRLSGSVAPTIEIAHGSHSRTHTLASYQEINGTRFYYGDTYGTGGAGNKPLVITYLNSCVDTAQDILLEEVTPITVQSIEANSPDCHPSSLEGEGKASAEVIVSGGGGGYVFSHLATPLGGKTYLLKEIAPNGTTLEFTVTDGWQNKITGQATVPIPQPVTTDTRETAPSMYCTEDGEAEVLTTTGGQAPYTYSRLNEAAQFGNHTTLTGYTSGSKSLYVKDSLGCLYECPVNIPEAPDPLQITNETTVLPRCYQENNGSYTFEVNRVLGTIAATSTDVRIQQNDIKVEGNLITLSNRNAGIYPITISDTYNGKVCDTTIYVEIPEKEPISIQAGVSPVIGKGTATGQINFEIQGGNPGVRSIYLYDDTKVLDSLITSENQVSFINLAGVYENGGKNYHIDIKDEQACIYSADNSEKFLFKIQEPEDSLKIQLELVAGITCNGESDAQVRAVPSGGWGSYQYSHENKANFQTGDLYTQLSAKEHTFYLTDSMGAIDSTRIEVLMPEVITSSIASIDSVKCHGTASGAIDFNIQGGVAPYRHSLISALQWSDGRHSENLAEGTYRFIFTDANNCIGQDTLSVYVPEPDTLDFKQIEVTQTTCNENNGKIAVELTGGSKPYTYTWTNFSGEPVGDAAILDNLSQSGYYHLAVEDKNGCTQSYEQAINPSNSPKIDSINIEHLKCFGDRDGAAKVIGITAPEPFAPYTLSWSDGTQESFSTSGLEAGLHYVRISDTNNCVYTEYFELSSPEKLDIALTGSKVPHCHNYADAYLEIQPTGGFGAYRYAWSNGASTQRVEELESGTYSVTLIDDNNCSISETFHISNPKPVALDLGRDIVICPGNGYVLDGFDYAAHKWEYAHEELSREQYIYADKPGDYYLTVTDSVGCFGYDTINVAIGNHALKAEFLLSNHSYRGDTLRLVELSNMPLDSLSWEYNPAIFEDVTANTNEEFDLLLKTLQLGMYNIQLYAWSGGCFSTRIKDVEIMERTDSADTYDFLGYTDPLTTSFQVSPNPNNGLFNVSVTLREPADIRLTVFSINKGLIEDERRAYGLDNYTISYSLESLYTGTYVIILTANNERRQVKMIIDK